MKTGLNKEQQQKVDELKDKLPSNWVKEFLIICETHLKLRYTKQNAYRILNLCLDDHDGWKVIEGIARRHQEAMEKVA